MSCPRRQATPSGFQPVQRITESVLIGFVSGCIIFGVSLTCVLPSLDMPPMALLPFAHWRWIGPMCPSSLRPTMPGWWGTDCWWRRCLQVRAAVNLYCRLANGTITGQVNQLQVER